MERDYHYGPFQPKPFMLLPLTNPRASRLTRRKSQLSWHPGCEVNNRGEQPAPFPFNPSAVSGEWKWGHACAGSTSPHPAGPCDSGMHLPALPRLSHGMAALGCWGWDAGKWDAGTAGMGAPPGC